MNLPPSSFNRKHVYKEAADDGITFSFGLCFVLRQGAMFDFPSLPVVFVYVTPL